MAPHYSGMSVGAYEQKLLDAAHESTPLEVALVRSWWEQPRFLDTMANRVTQAADNSSRTYLYQYDEGGRLAQTQADLHDDIAGYLVAGLLPEPVFLFRGQESARQETRILREPSPLRAFLQVNQQRVSLEDSLKER